MDPSTGDIFISSNSENPDARFSARSSPPQNDIRTNTAQVVPSSKRKRDKYTGKACDPCKARKIKVSLREAEDPVK